MKKALVILLLFSVSRATCQVDLGIRSSIGTFSMTSMHEFQENLLQTWPVQGKSVAAFPAFWVHEVLVKRTKNRLLFGAALSLGSTGGRNHYADYSGELWNNLNVRFRNVSAIIGHRFDLHPSLSLIAEVQPGFTYTRLELHNGREVDGVRAQMLQHFKSLNIFVEPSFSLQKCWGRFATHVRVGYHIRANAGKLLPGAGSLEYLKDGEHMVSSDWSGWRLGAGVGYKFRSTATRKDSLVTGVFVGIGLGQDYGGLGLNVLAYPHRNFGVFVGAGYALAGLGYNLGVKIRSTKPLRKVYPFLIAMYGYNAAVAIRGEPSKNQMFYGATYGVGVDTKISARDTGYWSFSLNAPVRSPDAEAYIVSLESAGYAFASRLLPMSFSVGYRFSR
jgi:hypothetical protein